MGVDNLNIKPEESQESQEHIDSMLKKAEEGTSVSSAGNEDTKQPTPQEEQEGEDKLLAGKYKNEEELQKGILELLKKSKGTEDSDEVSLEDLYKSLESEVLNPATKEKETEEEEEEDNDNKEIDEDAPIEEQVQDFSEYEQEFFENGELSEESYETLKKQGYSKEVVDRYIEGTKAIAEKQIQEVYQIVDGADNYEQMINWAADNLAPEEKQIFNRSVQSGDIYEAKFAVEALYSKFTRAEGQQPQRIYQGDKTTTTNTTGFESRAEVIEAMQDPRYEKDSAYRRQVEQKLLKSNVF